MLYRDNLMEYLNELLQPTKFEDFCPNGLQIEGNAEIKKIITGVTASQALIDAAIEKQADAIIVHHGYFWKNEPPLITGIKAKRIKSLMTHDINLLSYHIPLDAHAELGNNAQLAEQLEIQITSGLPTHYGDNIALIGKLLAPISAKSFAQVIEDKLDRKPTHIGNPEDTIETIAWCTGAAQHTIIDAINHGGIDAFISGEISESTVHIARENNMHYFAAGHHATERYGVKALGKHLEQTFPVESEFVDIFSPA